MNLLNSQSPVSILKGLIGNPQTTLELIAMVVVGILGLIIGIRVIGSLLGCAMADWGRGTGAVLVTTGLLLSALIAVNLYVLPSVSQAALKYTILGASLVIVFLGAAVPLSRLIIRGKYTQVLFTLLLSITAAAALMMVTRAGFHTARAGEKGINKAKIRNEKISDMQ